MDWIKGEYGLGKARVWTGLHKPGILAKVSKLENSKNTDYGQIS